MESRYNLFERDETVYNNIQLTKLLAKSNDIVYGGSKAEAGGEITDTNYQKPEYGAKGSDIKNGIEEGKKATDYGEKKADKYDDNKWYYSKAGAKKYNEEAKKKENEEKANKEKKEEAEAEAEKKVVKEGNAVSDSDKKFVDSLSSSGITTTGWIKNSTSKYKKNGVWTAAGAKEYAKYKTGKTNAESGKAYVQSTNGENLCLGTNGNYVLIEEGEDNNKTYRYYYVDSKGQITLSKACDLKNLPTEFLQTDESGNITGLNSSASGKIEEWQNPEEYNEWTTYTTAQALEEINKVLTSNTENANKAVLAIVEEYNIDYKALGYNSLSEMTINDLAAASGLSYYEIYMSMQNGTVWTLDSVDESEYDGDENNPFVTNTSVKFKGYENQNVSVLYNQEEAAGTYSNSASIYKLEAEKELAEVGDSTLEEQIEEAASLETPTNTLSSKGDIYKRVINAFTPGKSQNAQSDFILEKMRKKKKVSDTIPLLYHFPKWGINDFFRERANFQKQVDSIGGDRGWFYFKIFFHFNTEFGLLGGIMDRAANIPVRNTNTAFKYLAINRNIYKQEHILDRMDALLRFVRILSYVNSNAPWFFKEIKGLDKANNVYVGNFTKEKSIEITCNPDAVDMRLNALMDLYKYAAYDSINCKEILPENLRMFDMTVMVFHMPLRKYQTSIKSKSVGTCDNSNVFPAKTMSKVSYEDLSKPDQEADLTGGNYRSDISAQHVGNYSNTMSFEMFEFKDCSFNTDTVGNMIPGTLNNEKPFNLGNASIKINYNRCFRGSMNEWFDYLQTDGGSLFGLDYNITDNRDFQAARMKAMQKSIENINYYDPTKSQYKELIDASEAVVRDAMMSMDASIALGNIYDGENGEVLYKKHTLKNTDTENNSDWDSTNILTEDDMTNNYGEYFTKKLTLLKDGSISNTTNAKYLPNIFNLSPMLIHSGTETDNVQKSEYYALKLKQLKYGSAKGNIFNYNVGPRNNNEVYTNERSEYFKAKLEKLNHSGLSGNIFKYELVPNKTLYDGLPEYTYEKFEKLKKGTLKGNVFRYNTGTDSNYFKAKLDAIKGNRKSSKLKITSTEFGSDKNDYTDTNGNFKLNDLGRLSNNFNNNRRATEYLSYPQDLIYQPDYIKNNLTYRYENWAPKSLSLTRYENNVLLQLGSLSPNFNAENAVYYMEQYDGMTGWNSTAMEILSDTINGLINAVSTVVNVNKLADYALNIGTNSLNSLMKSITGGIL